MDIIYKFVHILVICILMGLCFVIGASRPHKTEYNMDRIEMCADGTEYAIIEVYDEVIDTISYIEVKVVR